MRPRENLDHGRHCATAAAPCMIPVMCPLTPVPPSSPTPTPTFTCHTSCSPAPSHAWHTADSILHHYHNHNHHHSNLPQHQLTPLTPPPPHRPAPRSPLLVIDDDDGTPYKGFKLLHKLLDLAHQGLLPSDQQRRGQQQAAQDASKAGRRPTDVRAGQLLLLRHLVAVLRVDLEARVRVAASHRGSRAREAQQLLTGSLLWRLMEVSGCTAGVVLVLLLLRLCC